MATSKLVYKILTDSEWVDFRTKGQFTGSSVDLRDGFIHFSAIDQVRETAEKHFAGQDNLVLIAVDSASCGANFKWEVSRNGDQFPHLYAILELIHVHANYPLKLDDVGRHQFPSGLI